MSIVRSRKFFPAKAAKGLAVGVKLGSATIAAVRSDGGRGRRTVSEVVREARVPLGRGGGPSRAVPHPEDIGAVGGFVERVGDPVPLIFPDGSEHFGEGLVGLVVRDLVTQLGARGAPVGLAVPLHWGSIERGKLDGALHTAGIAGASLVSMPVAVMSAPHIIERTPHGQVVVCDFGARTFTVSLVNCEDATPHEVASASSSVMSGFDIDHLLLRRALSLSGLENSLESADLAKLRTASRKAKAELSEHTATTIEVPNGVEPQPIRVTRDDLTELIRQSLEAVIAQVDQIFNAGEASGGAPKAIVLAGGGASIPVVNEKLSSRFRVPIVVGADPVLTACWGAAQLAAEPS